MTLRPSMETVVVPLLRALRADDDERVAVNVQIVVENANDHRRVLARSR